MKWGIFKRLNDGLCFLTWPPGGSLPTFFLLFLTDCFFLFLVFFFVIEDEDRSPFCLVGCFLAAHSKQVGGLKLFTQLFVLCLRVWVGKKKVCTAAHTGRKCVCMWRWRIAFWCYFFFFFTRVKDSTRWNGPRGFLITPSGLVLSPHPRHIFCFFLLSLVFLFYHSWSAGEVRRGCLALKMNLSMNNNCIETNRLSNAIRMTGR